MWNLLAYVSRMPILDQRFKIVTHMMEYDKWQDHCEIMGLHLGVGWGGKP